LVSLSGCEVDKALTAYQYLYRAGFYFALSGLDAFFIDAIQGRRASRLPLAIIFRAFGAKATTTAFAGHSMASRTSLIWIVVQTIMTCHTSH
jgi:hypothetical protein